MQLLKLRNNFSEGQVKFKNEIFGRGLGDLLENVHNFFYGFDHIVTAGEPLS